MSKTIRVCFVAPKAYPLFNSAVAGVIGGAELDLYYLATELAHDAGFAVSMVVADYGQEAGEEWEGVRVIKSLDFGKNVFSGGRRIWRALGKADAQIYVIKTFSPGVPLTSYFCKRHDRKFIYRTSCRYDSDGTFSRQRPILGWAFTWALRRASIVLSQNEKDAQLLKNNIGVTARVIPNGHRFRFLDKKENEVILWVGRSTHLKRPDLFIELAQKVPEEKFCMICQEATEDKNYSGLLEQARAVKNLQFISHVPFGEIDRYFQKARVIVNTSDTEGFPNVFIQGCQWAVPILSLNVNPDNFLDKHECGVCAHGDWDLFIKGLKMLLEPEYSVRFVSNGRSYVENKHDISKIIETYKIMFEDLVQKQKD